MYDVKPNFNINVLKNELGETFHVVFKLKNLEDHYLGLSQLYMTWRNENELKQNNQSNQDRYKDIEYDILCNTKKHEAFLEIVYEVLQNFSIAE